MKKKNTTWNIINIYNIVIIVLGGIFCYLIPNLLNYGPEVINSYFESQIDAGFNYYVQYAVVMLIVILFVDIFVWWQFRDIEKLATLMKNGDEKSLKEATKIKTKCFRLPYRLYLYEILSIPLAIALVLVITKTEINLIIKISFIVFLFATLMSIMAYVFTKRKIKLLLLEVGNLEPCQQKNKVSLENKIFLQIFPLLLVTAIFLGFVGYARLINEKGSMIYDEYSVRLAGIKENVNDETELYNSLKDVIKIGESDTAFIIKNEDVIYNEGEGLSDFFIKYAKLVGERYNGHLYDYYASDAQGTAIYLKIGDNNYIAGLRYKLDSYEMVIIYVLSAMFVLLVSVCVLIYFAKDMSDDIGKVGDYLYKLSGQGSIDYDEKLVVTTNDEIGDLINSFNKILDLEKNNIETMTRNQEILVEQERLSSLGQLIGGIAHNLKTPIMSISGALEGIEDLIKEYDESINDNQVTKEDHHQIAGEMAEWITKIRPYLSYMTEVIDAVKGQAVSMNASTVGEFSAEELIARTQILMKNELKRRHCNLNLDLNIGENSRIKGEISAIVQVMDNLIINAMDAYGENGGNIDIKVREDSEKIYIEVADLAGGISEMVKDKLFKEMITSKGKNGTGLGLYMCYSTIKGKFNGDMWFESKEGVGTTFHIVLNKL